MAIAHPLAVEPVDDGSRSVARPPRPPARGDRHADATRGGWPAAGPDGSQAGLRSPCRPPVVNSASRPPVLQATDRPRRDSSRAQPEVALPPRVNPAPSAPGGRHLARRPPVTEGRVTPITSAPPPPPPATHEAAGGGRVATSKGQEEKKNRNQSANTQKRTVGALNHPSPVAPPPHGPRPHASPPRWHDHPPRHTATAPADRTRTPHQ